MKKFDDVVKNYTLDEIMEFSLSLQKKVIRSLSLDNRIVLINQCKSRYYDALNDDVNFSFARVNKYANLYTNLIKYKNAA